MKYIGIFICILIVGYLGYIFFSEHPQKLPNKITNMLPTAKPTQSISTGNVPAIPFVLPNGFTIHVFADVPNARDMEFSFDGTLLVSSPATNSVYALPDKNIDGVADEEKQIISDEPHVHGLAFHDKQLFIADTQRVVRYNWNKTTQTATRDKMLFTLPANNNHNNRSLVFDTSGRLFVSVGSTCNVCRELPTNGGSVWVSDSNGTNPHVFASGLRNAAFLTRNPATGAIWDTEMGRDYLGDNLPPDEINILQNEANYGWPNCYADKVHDTNFDKNNNSCSNTIAPIFQIPAHSAPLGLTFINSIQFPKDQQGDLLIAYHGSWNRTTPIGFKIVHLKVNGASVTSSDDFLTGFLPKNATNGPDDALGRPADVIFDKNGNLYVSDDKAGKVYIIQKQLN